MLYASKDEHLLETEGTENAIRQASHPPSGITGSIYPSTERIFHEECRRETKERKDLLELARLRAYEKGTAHVVVTLKDQTKRRFLSFGYTIIPYFNKEMLPYVIHGMNN
jgi:hypothetical protein